MDTATYGPRFGIAIPQTFADPARDLEALGVFVQRAEALGIDSLWVQEQILGQDQSFEPLVMLAYAAAITSRVRLGSAAFIAPIRSPVHLAKELASLDQLSLGRLIVGLALGDLPWLFPAFGVDPRERLPRFLEAIQVMRRLWTEPRVTHHGRFWSLEDASMEPKPLQRPHPPLWFGAKSRPALERSVRLGSGWIGAGGSSTAEFARSAAIVRAGILANGRAPSSFTLAKKVYLAVESSRQLAHERLLTWFTRHWPASADPARLCVEVGMFGTASEVAAQLAEVVQAGADLVILNPVYDEERHLSVLADEVLPAVTHSMAAPRSPSRGLPA